MGFHIWMGRLFTCIYRNGSGVIYTKSVKEFESKIKSMNVWIVIWGIVILFSLVAFTIMSVKILYKGIGELKEMFHLLNKRK